jgi:hypothetical protein
VHKIQTRLPTGKIKSFGDEGIPYMVKKFIRKLDDGDWLVEIELIKTGELAEYRLSHIKNDPEAT